MPDDLGFIPQGQGEAQSQAPDKELGFVPADLTIQKEHALQSKYGTTEQQVKAGLEGVAKGIAGPLATLAETKGLGVSPEDIAGREEANPATHLGGEALGFVAGAALPVSQIKALGMAGEAGAAAMGLEGAVGTAAKLGIENALYTIGDETSKAITNNPASIQSAAMHVGLSGLLGAGLGFGIGKVGELWKAKVGPEADQFVQDFSGRLKAHAEGALPTADMVHSELANEFHAVESAKSDLRGLEGLKSHEIAQLLPQEVNPQMVQQANNVLKETEALLSKAEAEPGIYQGSRLPALRDYGARLATTLADPELTGQGLFTALDDFKKGLGSLKKWDITMGETDKPAASLMGDLYHAVRTSLEDPAVWGKAGERQAAINKLWTEHIPASKDFARTFTENVAGEQVISPTKVNTLLNGLGKPNAEIRLEKLSNYLEANNKLYKELDQIHSNLGIDNPYKRPELTTIKGVLRNLTPGMKAADFVQKQASNAAAEALGSGLGAVAGHMSGVPGGEYMGGLFGHYAIKPFLRTLMPSLIQPLLKVGASGAGLKAALEGASAIAKGESLLASSAKALFEVGSSAEMRELVPDKAQIDKLEKSLLSVREKPESITNAGGALSHYMPEHATVLASTAQNAINYLHTQEPQETRAGVLDRVVPPSPMAEATYRAALEIAESPLSVLWRVKSGTLRPEHVTHLQNLYPALLPSITQSVTSAMVTALSKDGVVPFKLRGSLSTLLGQPMDSTFSQPSMAAAQATFTPPQPPQGGPGMKKSTKTLSKSAELHQTPSEARTKALNKA